MKSFNGLGLYRNLYTIREFTDLFNFYKDKFYKKTPKTKHVWICKKSKIYIDSHGHIIVYESQTMTPKRVVLD